MTSSLEKLQAFSSSCSLNLSLVGPLALNNAWTAMGSNIICVGLPPSSRVHAPVSRECFSNKRRQKRPGLGARKSRELPKNGIVYGIAGGSCGFEFAEAAYNI